MLYYHFNKVRYWTLRKSIFALCSFCLIFTSFSAFSQQKNISTGKKKHLSVYVLAKSYGDSVVLRWAPENAVAWNLCRKAGFEISRIDYSNPKHPVHTLLTLQPFKPMTLAQMKTHLEHHNKYAAIAAQAMYGNTFRMTKQPPTGFANKIEQAHNAMNFRFGFAMEAADFSAPVASAIALRWVDKNVKLGSTYVYIISSTASNHHYVIDSSAVEITNVKEANPSPQGLKAFGFDHKIELHWNRMQNGHFSAYYIERSDDGGKNYHKLNKQPFNAPYQPSQNNKNKADSAMHRIASVLKYHEIFLDSIPWDYKTYYYRISGLNAFGEQSPWSAPVIVHGVDLTPPPAPVIDSARNISGNKIKIHWKQPVSVPDLKGYFIERASLAKGPYKLLTHKLISKEQTEFTDTDAVPHEANYYALIAVDTVGNRSISFPHVGYLTDTTAPAPPVDVAGTIDSTGVVHLHWKKNEEPDLKGYKVYFSYNPYYQFTQLTKDAISVNHFTDTISMKSLNRKIYYKVVAVDKSNNHSDYSSPGLLKKPVVVPPTPPVAGKIKINKKEVTIQWIQSRSVGAMGYNIYRKGNGKTWKPVGKLNQNWNVNVIYFTDSTIKPNTGYDYSAETIDSTGVHSARSFAVHVRYNAPTTSTGVTDLQASLDRKHQAVKLVWKYKGTGNYFFIVYRGTNKEPPEPWQSFEKGTLTCEDNQVQNGTYQYAIEIVHRDNTSGSELSKPVKIDVSGTNK